MNNQDKKRKFWNEENDFVNLNNKKLKKKSVPNKNYNKKLELSNSSNCFKSIHNKEWKTCDDEFNKNACSSKNSELLSKSIQNRHKKNIQNIKNIILNSESCTAQSFLFNNIPKKNYLSFKLCLEKSINNISPNNSSILTKEDLDISTSSENSSNYIEEDLNSYIIESDENECETFMSYKSCSTSINNQCSMNSTTELPQAILKINSEENSISQCISDLGSEFSDSKSIDNSQIKENQFREMVNCVTPKKIKSLEDDDYFDSDKRKKKKFIKGGLAERLSKLIVQQRRDRIFQVHKVKLFSNFNNNLKADKNFQPLENSNNDNKIIKSSYICKNEKINCSISETQDFSSSGSENCSILNENKIKTSEFHNLSSCKDSVLNNGIGRLSYIKNAENCGQFKRSLFCSIKSINQLMGSVKIFDCSIENLPYVENKFDCNSIDNYNKNDSPLTSQSLLINSETTILNYLHMLVVSKTLANKINFKPGSFIRIDYPWFLLKMENSTYALICYDCADLTEIL